MRQWMGAFGAAGLVCVLTGPAYSQATGGQQSNDTSIGPAAEIETVTVTARRREEDLQKVPLNVTAISGDLIREQEIKTATDLQTAAPTLTVTGTLGSRDDNVFTIRGQSQPFGGADPGVQTYFAEVPYNAEGPGSFFDMSSIQVLSGPQGTLFGRNTTGGAVLFEPQRPKDEFGGYVDGQLGNYNFREISGALNVPVIGDKLLVRGAFDVASRNGFTKDEVITGASAPFTVDQDNLDYQAYRLGVTWKPFDHFENYTVFDYLHNRTNGTSDVLTGIASQATLTNTAAQQLIPIYIGQFALGGDPNAVADGTAAGSAAAAGYVGAFYPALQGALANQQALGPRQTTSSIVPLYRRETWSAIDIARYDITPDLYVRNIFGYLSDKTQSGFDYDGSYLPILEIPNPRTWETNSFQVTEELQVGGETTDKSINWIFGAYHELDHPEGYSEVERDVFGGGGVPSPLSLSEVDSFGNGGTSNAVYGSTTYNASSWVNGLSVTAGGRYTWDHKVATALSCIYSSYLGSPPCPSPLNSAYMQPTLAANFHAPTWTLALNYQATDDTMVYATYRRGYKSGGFNSGVAATSGFSEFQPEFLTDVEVGTKNNWTLLGVPGRTNFDGYYGWYNDVQKNDLIDVDGVPSALTLNAARASIKGIDFETTVVPDDHLDITAFYSYIDASYGRFALPQAIIGSTQLGILNHSGNPFAYTPANKLGVTAHLRFRIDRALGVPVFSVSWYNQSRVWFTDLADEEPDGSQGGYSLVNLRLDWNDFMGTSADVAFFVNNVADQLYKVGGNPLEHLTGTDSSIYGAPRMWGVELRYRFGQDAKEE
ncbi:MAG TPA: TonB-dependent receptor [Rhizomicrobium sp.]|nr:TonB-dependent receptor [Rhizomicrobium sp.]